MEKGHIGGGEVEGAWGGNTTGEEGVPGRWLLRRGMGVHADDTRGECMGEGGVGEGNKKEGVGRRWVAAERVQGLPCSL